MEGNVVKVGKGRQTDNSPTSGSPGELPDEANKVSYIHTHPDGGNGTKYNYNQVVCDRNGKILITPIAGFIRGEPFPNDKGFSGQFRHRSVAVDAKIQGDKKMITVEGHD